jgi:eukaryotic-like serine/threonine-protein kinase
MSRAGCPDFGQLLRFLEGPSPGVDDNAIVAHVEGCNVCRVELERLVAGTGLSGLSNPRTVHEASADLSFLADLKHLDLRHLSDQPAPRANAEGPLPEIPGYELLSELGRGGAGVVYHARHCTLGRPVAIKMLHHSLFPTETDRRRLRAEAEAVARLQHPNVVQLYETGEVGGSPYLVLEYVSGGTLESHLGGRPQPPTAAAALVKTLAQAVHAAHLKQIIHRDLKPANILLQRDAEALRRDRRAKPGARSGPPCEFGVPKITDFGLAKQLDRTASGLTQTLSGTPAYMSPEQIPERAGELPPAPITSATDVYALGVIIYEMLTGRPPFLGTDWVTTLLQVVRRAPVPPRELQPSTPRDLQTICLKCLEKEPLKRYATAEELADDLGRFLDDKPISARPVGILGRIGRWGRRNPVPAASLAALAATGIVSLTAILWEWRNAEALAKSLTIANFQSDERLRRVIDAQKRAERASDDARRRGEAERRERYRANIAAAAAALQLQNSETARRALEAAPREHRNWEWRHLEIQLDGARAAVPGFMPSGSARQMPVISPSGQQLATVNQDGHTINIWDVTTGTAIGAHRGHEGLISALAYSPDGRCLASGSADKTVRLWDVDAGKEVAVLRGHDEPVAWLSFSPDGGRICSLDGASGRLWDATTGQSVAILGVPKSHVMALFAPDGRRIVIGSAQQISTADAISGRRIAVLGSHEGQILHLAVCPDGKRIASHGLHEKTVHLWDAVTGQPVAVLKGDVEYTGALSFSPDGLRLASGSVHPDNTVRLWDAATGRLIATMSGHKNTIRCVMFGPDGGRIVSASSDQTAWLWDGVTGRLIAPLRGHTGSLWLAIISPDGKRVITGSADHTLRLWDASSGDLIAVLRGHKAEVCGAAFAAHGSLVVSRSVDGESRVWNLELVERNGILRGHESFVYDVAFSLDGLRAASAAWDGTVRIWDATAGRQTAVLRHDDHSRIHPNIVTSVAWHPDGGQIATVTRGDTITLWHVSTGNPTRVIKAPTGTWDGDVRAVFNPAGTLLASGSRDGCVRLWNAATGTPAGVLRGHTGAALDVAFSADGTRLASVGSDRTVHVWDVETRSAVAVLPGDREGYRVAYSADGCLIAACSLRGNVRLWDAHTYKELANLPHGNRVLGLAFSREGSRLATACGDNTIRLWDLATRQEVCELRGHDAYVHAVAFSPDGTRLASASGDSTVRIWDTVPQSVRARPPAYNL